MEWEQLCREWLKPVEKPARRAHLGLRVQPALQELTVQAEPVQLVKSLQLEVARLF